jgi:transcription elongation factor Elf1
MSLLTGQPFILEIKILCPNCSKNVPGIIEPNITYQSLKCSECGAEWQFEFAKNKHSKTSHNWFHKMFTDSEGVESALNPTLQPPAGTPDKMEPK